MSEMVILENTRPTLLHLATGQRLEIGDNLLPAEVVEENETIDAFKSWLSAGWVRIKRQAAEKAGGPDKDVAPWELPVGRAKDLAKKTSDLELLDRWYSQENRTTVLKVLEERTDELTAG